MLNAMRLDFTDVLPYIFNIICFGEYFSINRQLDVLFRV